MEGFTRASFSTTGETHAFHNFLPCAVQNFIPLGGKMSKVRDKRSDKVSSVSLPAKATKKPQIDKIAA